MSEFLKILLNHHEHLLVRLSEALEREMNASATNVGESINEVDKYEKLIIISNKKIANARALSVSDGPEGSYNIFIISDSINNVIKHLSKRFYDRLILPVHGDDSSHWVPFIRERRSIKSILDEIKGEGFEFKEFYLSGIPTGDELDAIVKNHEHNIGIFDLLALHARNELLAIRFDDERTRAVITPICSFIDTHIKLHMMSQRDKVFSYLKRNFYSSRPDLYHPVLSEYEAFTAILRRLLPKKRHSNRIDNYDGGLNLGMSPGLSI